MTKDKTIGKYLKSVYTLAFVVFYALGVVSTFGDIIYFGNNGRAGTAIAFFVFFWAVAAMRAVLPTFICGTVIALIGALPYYIYTRLGKAKEQNETN